MAYKNIIGSVNGNTFGNASWSVGKGQRVWREIRHRIPAGAKVSNVAAFIGNDNTGIIPAGSPVVYDAANKAAAVVGGVTAYSTSGTYAVGDYVTNSGKLYVNKTAIASGESFTSSKWTEIAAIEGYTQEDVPVSYDGTNYDVATVTIVYAGELYAFMYDATTLAVLKKLTPAEIHFVY